jgi:hypothetical protein
LGFIEFPEECIRRRAIRATLRSEEFNKNRGLRRLAGDRFCFKIRSNGEKLQGESGDKNRVCRDKLPVHTDGMLVFEKSYEDAHEGQRMHRNNEEMR